MRKRGSAERPISRYRNGPEFVALVEEPFVGEERPPPPDLRF